MVYALELLAGVRPVEAAALRWRHDDPTVTLLGKILVAKSYNIRGNIEKTTRPTRQAHFGSFRAGRDVGAVEARGVARDDERAPRPDDLIVTLPPDTVERRARH